MTMTGRVSRTILCGESRYGPVPPACSGARPTGPPQPVLGLPVDASTLARLHGAACIVCGDRSGPLAPAGYVYTGSGDGRLGWAIVACPRHRDTR
ncbi:hypothetical protein ACIQGZ_16860 [Streptomyces sp. NPDC092296]|uniref:hypothetical protein n=1 Tax=Streptomyces sp. NPDC092296 TaxID=3366012 RepID=UPI003817D251